MAIPRIRGLSQHARLMGIQLVRGDEAHAMLGDQRFVQAWARLCDQCPWATPFQTPDFALAWYSVYRFDREPVLVLSRDPSGGLRGLLTLAAPKGHGLAVAGESQAEYQVWICAPEDCDSFAASAVRAIRFHFPTETLRFHYVPANTPLGWLSDKSLRVSHLLRPYRRPLLRLTDGLTVAASLAKVNNKSKLKRLEKLGPLRFIKLTDPDQIARCLDDVITFYDIRRLAVDGYCPFELDQQKKPFYLALSATSEFLHVTLLYVGDQIASAHVGAYAKGELQLGLMAHNPFMAKHSPGKLHLLKLAELLREEGFRQLDLTAGGDPYKERFCNSADRVHSLAMFPSRMAKFRDAIFSMAEHTARSFLARRGISTKQAKAFLARAKEFRPFTSLKMPTSGTPPQTQVAVQRHDCLADLLKYRPAGRGPSRQTFVSDALRRIEKGEHFWTSSNGSSLLSIEFSE